VDLAGLRIREDLQAGGEARQHEDDRSMGHEFIVAPDEGGGSALDRPETEIP
jgi:hypothetical protein